jgi:hypothetical protein
MLAFLLVIALYSCVFEILCVCRGNVDFAILN